MVKQVKKIEIEDNFSPKKYILKCIIFFGLIFIAMSWSNIRSSIVKLTPASAKEMFYSEVSNFYTVYKGMMEKDFDFSVYKKNPKFFKKFAGFFNLSSTCSDYTEPCLWNSMTYKTLDGEISPSYFGVPNVGQFITKSGALYMLYAYEDNNLWIFVDVNGIKGKPNRFGVDVFSFYIDSGNPELQYMGAKGTPYKSLNLYCNPYDSNKYNGLACSYKVVLDENYFDDTFKALF